MSRRKLIYLTGTRADYLPMRSVLLALANDRQLDIGLIVTGMHLEEAYGFTKDLITQDGLRILATVPILDSSDGIVSMTDAMSRLMVPLARILEDLQPDALMLTGDRGEMLAGAICGAHLDIPVLHFCGGCVSGSIDDSVRHAITRFAHVHFPSTRSSLDRLVRMGEDPACCFLVGLPGADLLADAVLSREDVEAKLGIGLNRDYVVVLQHAVTHERNQAATQMANTLESICRLGIQAVVLLPNSDSGGQAMRGVIYAFASREPSLHIVGNLPRPVFASLLLMSSALVGNSSCGVGEAVSLGIPVVNIGTRQRGRERMGNTIDVGYGIEEIARGVRFALSSRKHRDTIGKCKNEYMMHGTEDRVLEIMKSVDFGRFVPKRPLWGSTGTE